MWALGRHGPGRANPGLDLGPFPYTSVGAYPGGTTPRAGRNLTAMCRHPAQQVPKREQLLRIGGNLMTKLERGGVTEAAQERVGSL